MLKIFTLIIGSIYVVGCAASLALALGGCAPDTEEPAPPIAEPALSCGESNGLCRKVCYGLCDDEESKGSCSGTCNGACCTAVPE